MQGYTKDAGQDMALEQLIWPTIPTNTGKMQSAMGQIGTNQEYLYANKH